MRTLQSAKHNSKRMVRNMEFENENLNLGELKN